jgi:hypothetical protein
MVAFNKVDTLNLELGTEGHQLATDTLKIALSNTAPTAASTVWSAALFPPPAAANGYNSANGGNTVTTTSFTQTSGVAKLILADSLFTASAGGIGPFQYAILHNSSSSPAEKIIGWYNYGSAVTLNDTETFTVDFDPSTGALTIT